MKKTLAKILAVALCAVLLVSGTVYITLAYLQSQSNVVQNTFTVSDIQISLDEAKVNAFGKIIEGADRVTAQDQPYKLIPETTYVKDPTVHITEGNEPCFIVIGIHDTVFGENNEFEGDYEGKGTIYTQIENNGWIKLTGCTIDPSILTTTDGMSDWFTLAENGTIATHDYTLYYYNGDKSTDAIIPMGEATTDLAIFEGFTLKEGVTTTQLKALEDKVFEVVAFAMQTVDFGPDFDAAVESNDVAEQLRIAFTSTFGE